jgi:hypothetical protein
MRVYVRVCGPYAWEDGRTERRRRMMMRRIYSYSNDTIERQEFGAQFSNHPSCPMERDRREG